jgi:hypothetical protein
MTFPVSPDESIHNRLWLYSREYALAFFKTFLYSFLFDAEFFQFPSLKS